MLLHCIVQSSPVQNKLHISVKGSRKSLPGIISIVLKEFFCCNGVENNSFFHQIDLNGDGDLEVVVATHDFKIQVWLSLCMIECYKIVLWFCHLPKICIPSRLEFVCTVDFHSRE